MTSLPGSLDGTVKRISTTYTAKGAVNEVTSHSSATVGSGSVVNQIGFEYSPWGQVTADKQAHGGAVTGTTPEVSYAYGDGTANRILPESITHPSGRRIDYRYGVPVSDNGKLGRIEGLRKYPESSNLVSYEYAGLNRYVKVTYDQPEVELTYISSDGQNGDDAGDPYIGWDRFGRTQNMRWLRQGTTMVEQVKYGYDRASQRVWRENPVATDDYSAKEDEYYDYDGLYQLTGRQRGTLNTGRTSIGGTPVRGEAFEYDPIGNWDAYAVSQNGSQTFSQTRGHTTTNEIAKINGSSSLVGYDDAGNMTKSPPPEDGSWTKAFTLKWDAWNRLVEVRNNIGSSLVANYAYDGLFRRTLKTVGSQITHYYYNQQWRPVEERIGNATVANMSYDWGLRYRDDLVRRVSKDGFNPPDGSGSSDSSSSGSSSGGGGPKSFIQYALHDYYNVTGITDENGNVLERYGYSAFGDLRYMTAGFGYRAQSGYDWTLLYKGQFRDDETGYYNYGFRYYNVFLGRWLSRDPIGEEGGIDLYGFVENNSPNGQDHLGLQVSTAEGVESCTVYFFWGHSYDVKTALGEQAKKLKPGCAAVGGIACNSNWGYDDVEDQFPGLGIPSFPRTGDTNGPPGKDPNPNADNMSGISHRATNGGLNPKPVLPKNDANNTSDYWAPNSAEGWLQSMEEGWAAAISKGEDLCRSECCKNKIVKVRFKCASDDIVTDERGNPRGFSERSPTMRYIRAHRLAGRKGMPKVGQGFGGLPFCNQEEAINCREKE